jgi:hypothetical protein
MTLVGTPTVNIDPTVRHQVMRGWELTADYPDAPSDPKSFTGYDDMLKRLVTDGGINRLRVEVRSGAETRGREMEKFFMSGELAYEDWKPFRYPSTNDNDDPNVTNWDGFDFSELDHHITKTVLPMRELLRAQGEELLINVCFVSFEGASPLHRDPEEYAEFVLAAYIHMDENFGFVPDMWEVLLEPDHDDPPWTGRMMGEAIAAAGRRLEENGYTPAFVAPSVTDLANAVPYMRAIAATPGARKYVAEFSYHPYQNRSDRRLKAVGAMGRELDIPTSQLEWWFGHATQVALHEDLTMAEVSSWQGRVVRGFFQTSTDDGGIMQFGDFNPDTRHTSVYFRNVRLGAVRIGAETDSWQLAPTAFLNTDGTVAVFVQMGGDSEAKVAGLPAGTYRLTYTTDDETIDMESGIEVQDGGEITFDAPPRSTVLITSRSGISLRE